MAKPKPVSAQANYDFAAFKADLTWLFDNAPIQGALLFNAFGTNPDSNFAKHKLSDAQIQELCDGDCGAKNIGVNFGTYYKGGDYARARTHKMNWTLEIAQASIPPERIADVINNEGVAHVIIRIGVGNGSGGFDKPQDYANYLKAIASQVGGKEFYAIAGPNEPDLEKWFAPSCNAPDPNAATTVREAYYTCVGKPLADYMNAVTGAGIPSNVKLLSPAFNLTSFTFADTTNRPSGIPRAMVRAGARFDRVSALAGNIYPNGDSMQNIWNRNVAGVMNELGKAMVITETGPWNNLLANPGALDLSKYPDYNAKDEEVYIAPILGLAGAARNIAVIRNDLIKQGYEAKCATPGFKIELTQSGKEWMNDYVDLFKPGTVFGGAKNAYIRARPSGPYGEEDPIRSTLTVDYRDVEIPLFRDVNGKMFLTSSIEEFFGYKDTIAQDKSVSEVNSAAINSLLSNKQRCQVAATLLVKQEEMCLKLQSPDACAFYPRQVQGTNYTIKTMLAAYKQEAGGSYKTPETIKKTCEDLYSTQNASPNTDLRQGLSLMPLHLDRAYRLGFLVTAIQLRYPTWNTMFHFFTHPNAGPVGGPSHPTTAILVNAFKVPDITTNKGTAGTGQTPWTDPGILTRNSLLTKKTIAETEKKGEEKRQTLATTANYYNTNEQTSADAIFCVVGQAPVGIGGPECNDELSKALTDIINAQAKLNKPLLECPEDPTNFKIETSGGITDPGALDPRTHPSKVYSVAFGAQLLENIFRVAPSGARQSDADSTHQVKPLGQSDPMFAETWKEGDPETSNPLPGVKDWGLKSMFHVVTQMQEKGFPYCCKDERIVKHYLVYPEGYDLQTIEDTLAGSFFSQEQLKSLVEKEQEYDRIKVEKDIITFEGGDFSKTFVDTLDRPPNTPPDSDCTPIQQCTYNPVDKSNDCRTIGWKLPCNRTFGFKIQQKNEALSAGVLGGKLGFWLREVQKSLNSSMSVAKAYLDTCETTEQFLTGRCGEQTITAPVREADDCTGLACASAPAPTGPAPTGVCDTSKPYLVTDLSVDSDRNFWLDIRCPNCTSHWGDIGTDLTSSAGNFHWGPNNLPQGGMLRYPCSTCSPSSAKVPASIPSGGQFCVNITLSSNASGDQCQQDRVRSLCTTVP